MSKNQKYYYSVTVWCTVYVALTGALFRLIMFDEQHVTPTEFPAKAVTMSPTILAQSGPGHPSREQRALTRAGLSLIG